MIPVYKQLEYNENCSKISESLWQYCRDEPEYNVADSESFKFKSKTTSNTNDAGAKDIKIALSLKHLINFWRTLEVLLPINCLEKSNNIF